MRGNRYAFTVTDLNTKWVETGALVNKSAKVVWGFLESIIIRWGAPRVILSDQGREFNNELINSKLDELGVQHRLTASYTPRTNGQAERTNQNLKRQLERICAEGLIDWDLRLLSATMAINKVVNSSTRYSPFILMHGWEPAVISDSNLPNNGPADDEVIALALGNRIENLQQIRELSVENIRRAQERQVRSHARRNGVSDASSTIQVGSLVKLFNARKRTRQGYSGTSYLGPYTVVRIDNHRQCTLRSQSGQVLNRKYPISKLVMFNEDPHQEFVEVTIEI
jgi:transposase InsO family protein